MNGKALGAAAIALGLLFIAVGLYQTNQYIVSGATTAATLKMYDQLGMDAQALALQKASTAASMAEVTGALVTAIFIDYALGFVLVIIGLFMYPDR